MVLANDPLFLREVLKDYIDKHDRNLKKSFMKSYAAHTSNPAKEETEYTKQSNCHICGGTHNMGNCTIFNKQTVEERSRTLVKKKLYYGCYMPIIVDHNARTWYAPKRRGGSNIAITSSANPTENDNLGASSVQVVSNFAEMDMKCASAKIPAKIISMCVVPVKIGHVRTKKEVSRLAILSNCSQRTFMKENIKKKLGISGRKTEITIKILNGKQNMESTVVTWLKVSKNGHGEGFRWLNFPAKHTTEALRADAEEVATQENARKREHFKTIADKLPTETNKKIGLAIGANCSKALEPEEVLPSKDGGSFAFRTPL